MKYDKKCENLGERSEEESRYRICRIYIKQQSEPENLVADYLVPVPPPFTIHSLGDDYNGTKTIWGSMTIIALTLRVKVYSK
jgi:hypothetical protein